MPSTSSQPIFDILQHKLIPWIREHGMNRVIVAQPTAKQMSELPGISLTPNARKGKRIAARGKNHNEILATWPSDMQVEVLSPQMVFVTAGQADLHFGDYTLHCTQGEGIFIPPGVPKPMGDHPHLIGDRLVNGYCELLWFRPLGQRIQIWICRSQGAKHMSPQSDEIAFTLNETSVRWLDDLRRELSSPQNNDREIANHLLCAFLLSVWRDLQEERYFLPSASPENEDQPLAVYPPIARAQQYIREHLYEKLTIEQVARIVYLSRAQFAKRFHSETGQTFTEFVTQCRLEQAVIMLKETDFTLTYICRVLGYRSPTYFNGLFVKHYNTSPLAYRKAHHGTQRPDKQKTIKRSGIR
jgi:AraC-like DNA-binding protein